MQVEAHHQNGEPVLVPDSIYVPARGYMTFAYDLTGSAGSATREGSATVAVLKGTPTLLVVRVAAEPSVVIVADLDAECVIVHCASVTRSYTAARKPGVWRNFTTLLSRDLPRWRLGNFTPSTAEALN